jgi:hypothetical protein
MTLEASAALGRRVGNPGGHLIRRQDTGIDADNRDSATSENVSGRPVQDILGSGQGRVALEPVVTAAMVESRGDDQRSRCKDHRETGEVNVRVERQEPGLRESVTNLKDQGRGKVPVADHDVAGGEPWPDLGVEMVVPVRSDQTGQCMPGDLVYHRAGKRADRSGGRLSGDMDTLATAAQLGGDSSGRGGLADAAGPVDGDE